MSWGSSPPLTTDTPVTWPAPVRQLTSVSADWTSGPRERFGEGRALQPQLRGDRQRVHRATGVVDGADDDLGADRLDGSFGHESPIFGMCGGRDHRPAAPGGRVVVPLRGPRWVVGVEGSTAIPAGRCGARAGSARAERARVGRGHEGVVTGEAGEACARGGCGGVGLRRMRPALKATVMRWMSRAVVRMVAPSGPSRGVPVHGVGAAPRCPSTGVVVLGRAGPLERGTGGRPRTTAGIDCGASRFPVKARHARPPFRARASSPPPPSGRPRPGLRRSARPLGLLGVEPPRDRLPRSRGRAASGRRGAAPPRGSSPRPPAARRAPAPPGPGRARSTRRRWRPRPASPSRRASRGRRGHRSSRSRARPMGTTGA